MQVTNIASSSPILAAASVDGDYAGDDADWTTSQYGLPRWWKEPVVAATTGPVVIGQALVAGAVVDGVTLVAGDRVLVRAQPTASENGIYIVDPEPYRSADLDDDAEIAGGMVVVLRGSQHAGTLWRCSVGSNFAIGTGAMPWSRTLNEAAVATGARSFALGSNTAAAGVNSLAIGTSSIASNANAFAYGSNSWAISSNSLAGGDSSVADGYASVATGVQAHAFQYGEWAHSAGGGGGLGVSQHTYQTAYATTVGTTSAVVKNGGGQNVLDFNGYYNVTAMISGHIIARRTDATGNNHIWSFTGAIAGDGVSSYAWIGGSSPKVTTIEKDAGTNAYTAALSISGSQVLITVTGDVGHTVVWHATLETDEVTG